MLLLGGEVDAEVLGFDGDAVEAAFFAEDDEPFGVDQRSGKRLDGFGDMKLAGDGAAFAHEEIFADDRLPGSEGITGQSADESGDVADFLEVQRDGNVIEGVEGHGDFAEVGVAGAFAHAVDGALNPLRAAADGGDGAGGGQAEIVVTVEVQRDGRADPFADLAEEKLDGFGAADADGVHDDEFAGAGVESVFVKAAEGIEFGARAVDGEEGDFDAVLDGVGNGIGGAALGFFGSEAVGFQFDGAGGSFDDGGAGAEAQKFVHIGANGAGEAPDFGFKAGVGDEFERFGVVGGDARKAGFDALDAERIQRAGDFQFLRRGKNDADGLLAVAERGVVEMDGFRLREGGADFGALVEIADPDAFVLRICAHGSFAQALSGWPCFHEMTGLRRMPIFSISHSTMSPGLR